jgi:hypothetical protein
LDVFRSEAARDRTGEEAEGGDYLGGEEVFRHDGAGGALDGGLGADVAAAGEDRRGAVLGECGEDATLVAGELEVVEFGATGAAGGAE